MIQKQGVAYVANKTATVAHPPVETMWVVASKANPHVIAVVAPQHSTRDLELVQLVLVYVVSSQELHKIKKPCIELTVTSPI